MNAVVSDTSPLRALHHLALTSLLAQLYGEVFITPAVASELSAPAAGVPPLLWRKVSGLRLREPRDTRLVASLLERLDGGESEAIALALQLKATAILMDEREARAVAVSLGLRPVGVLALLVRAKERGQVHAVRPLVDRLRAELGFRVSDQLYGEISRLANE